MGTLTILRGVPASGKSTYAQSLSSTVRVNRDDIRFALYGVYWGGNIDEAVVTKVEDAAIEAGLAAGSDVVVDATNLSRKHLRTKLSLASRYGAGVTFVDFPVTQETAIRYDATRERHVGPDVIKGFFKRYKIDPITGVLPAPPEQWPTFEPYVCDISKPYAYIIDTDGTVANHEGVRNAYDTTRYHLDTVHRHVASVVNGLDWEGSIIIALSGRDEEFRNVTETWWGDNRIPFDEFFFRPKGDRRVDAVVKYELFKTHIEPNYNVLGAFDDRPQVIRMWRTIGVPVFDVGNGEEF